MLSDARSLCEAKHNNIKVNCSSFCNKKEQEQLKTDSIWFNKRNNLDIIFSFLERFSRKAEILPINSAHAQKRI